MQRLVQNHLPGVPVSSFEPDLCVAMGAAVQAGVLSGAEIESILVDVVPHSLGIAAMMDVGMGIPMPGMFSTIIPRNTVIPTSRSEIYTTSSNNQEKVEIEVYQGENAIAKENVPLGAFMVEGLPPKPAGAIQVEVSFDFDINGILTVTATEKGAGQQGSLVVNDADTGRLSSNELVQARESLDELFDLSAGPLMDVLASAVEEE